MALIGAFHSSEGQTPGFSKHLADSEGRTRAARSLLLWGQPVPGPAFQPADGHRGRAAGQRREETHRVPEEMEKVYKSDPSLAL